MSEYINIISKEAITAVPAWIAFAGGAIPILLILSTFVYMAIVKEPLKVVKYLGIVSVIGITLAIAWACISCAFFSEPTGEYKYKVTLDKDNITVAEYEQFIKEYHPNIKDDVYYFTAGDLE